MVMERFGAGRFHGLETVVLCGLEVPLASSPLIRLLGLAWLDRCSAGTGLLIPDCHSVHTFGMRFTLDLIFLDAQEMVLERRNSVGRCRIVTVRGADAVVELPSGGEFDPVAA